MTRPAYYNEFNKNAAQWLRNLIAAGIIAPGHVDDRSISDVRPSDLDGYGQCHFFAGIGVWSYALRRAGVPDDYPVWTGSCPCQPFSSAGSGNGFDDERHLWPDFQYLIAQRRPIVVLGEQVSSKDAEPWLDLVRADLEALGFAVGAVAFPSAGVGAPHIRDRMYWGASRRGLVYPGIEGLEGLAGYGDHWHESGRLDALTPRPTATTSATRGMAHSDGVGRERPGPTNGAWGAADWLFCTDGKWRAVEPGSFPLAHGATARVGRLHAYGNAINAEAALAFIQCVQDAGLLPV